QDTGTGQWTATVLLTPTGTTPGAPTPLPAGVVTPALSLTTLTDLCPVPGTSDFYLTTTGDTAATPGDTCFFFDSTVPGFRATNLRGQLAPLDPGYAVTVDPTAPTELYVGTVTGVWKGVRTSPTAHSWTAMVNELPQAAVQ